MKYVQCFGRYIRFFVASAALIQTITVDAAVLYEAAGGMSSFKTSYENGNGRLGWLVRDYRPGWKDATQFPAMPFMLSEQSEVTGFELALTALADWSRNYTVQILGDSSSLPDVSSLWTASSLDVAPVFDRFATYSFTDVSGNPILLEAETQYWLSISCVAPCELSWWLDASNPAPGATQANSLYPHNLRWYPIDMNSAMFRVIGNVVDVAEPASVEPIPEPAPILLIGLGLAFLVMRRARS